MFIWQSHVRTTQQMLGVVEVSQAWLAISGATARRFFLNENCFG